MNTEPPAFVIESARKAALQSPCAKSKRGAALFNREDVDRLPQLGFVGDREIPIPADIQRRAEAAAIVAVGFNSQPLPFTCSGSDRCRWDCGKLCLHAEERAIRAAGALDDVADLELVHVEVVDGQVVPGGGPSCWQCSRLVVEVKLRGVWLFEYVECPSNRCPMCTGEECRLCGATAIRAIASSRHPDRAMINAPVLVGGCDHGVEERHLEYEPTIGEWKFYSAEQFHAETLRNEVIGDPGALQAPNPEEAT